MAEGLEQIAALADPIGEISDMKRRPSGIQVGKMRVPLGVIGIIYEARPNVTVDAAGLCLKSGNAAILRGGSEAIRCNRVLAALVHDGLLSAGLPEAAVQVIETTDRAAVGELVTMKEYVDVIVPRGGKGLIERISNEARVPVIKHLDGICHVYIDDDADIDKALRIADNAKTQRYGTCNTMETLLVARSVAPAYCRALARMLVDKGVELRGCAATREVLNAAPDAGVLPIRLQRKRTGAPSTWRRSCRCVSSTVWTRRSTTSTPTVRSIPTPSSPRTTPSRCASCAKSIPAPSWSMLRRALPTVSNTASAPRSAFRPTSCTPAGRSASKASPARSGSCSATARCALELSTWRRVRLTQRPNTTSTRSSAHRSAPSAFSARAHYVSEITYLPHSLPPRQPTTAASAVALEAARQLVAYLSDPDFTFDLPLRVCGTDFQRRVWRRISAIRRGTTRRYGELAHDLGSAPRAVGQACGADPLPIVVPCHRVVAAAGGLNGGLGGFAHSRDGFLVDVKRWLLRHEGVLTER